MPIPQRTTGVAPLAVMFDVTADQTVRLPPGAPPDYGSLHYSWSYGDSPATWSTTGRSKNSSLGMIGAHVYESAGTHRVHLVVAGEDRTETGHIMAITVTDPATVFAASTIYLSATGNDSNPGTQAQPFLTWDHAISVLFASNGPRRLRVNRGDTFTTSTHHLLGQLTGPFQIDAYGSGADPIVQCSNDYGLLYAQNVSDFRIIDISLESTATTPVQWQSALVVGDDALALRCSIVGFSIGVEMRLNRAAIVDCTIEDCSSYCVTGFSPNDATSQYGAVLGCALDNAGLHAVRYTMSRFLVGESSFGAVAFGHAIKQHGRPPSTPQLFCCTVGNIFETAIGWVHAIGPQDDYNSEHSLDTLIEGNLYRPNGAAGSLIACFAERVTIRNNVFDVATGAECIAVRQRGVGPVPTRVMIEHNTMYRRTGSPLQTMLNCQSLGLTPVRNNIFYCAGGSVLPAGNVLLSNNVTANPLFVDAPNLNYAPDSGSPAIDIATTSQAKADYNRDPRVTTSDDTTLDAGAVEHVEGS